MLRFDLVRTSFTRLGSDNSYILLVPVLETGFAVLVWAAPALGTDEGTLDNDCLRTQPTTTSSTCMTTMLTRRIDQSRALMAPDGSIARFRLGCSRSVRRVRDLRGRLLDRSVFLGWVLGLGLLCLRWLRIVV